MATRVRVRSGTEIRMTKTRADGTQVDLGVVSADYTNPARRLWWRTLGKRLADGRIRRESKHTAPHVAAPEDDPAESESSSCWCCGCPDAEDGCWCHADCDNPPSPHMPSSPIA